MHPRASAQPLGLGSHLNTACWSWPPRLPCHHARVCQLWQINGGSWGYLKEQGIYTTGYRFKTQTNSLLSFQTYYIQDTGVYYKYRGLGNGHKKHTFYITVQFKPITHLPWCTGTTVCWRDLCPGRGGGSATIRSRPLAIA